MIGRRMSISAVGWNCWSWREVAKQSEEDGKYCLCLELWEALDQRKIETAFLQTGKPESGTTG